MRVALVHDYLNEFGGAERVLEALSEIYPDAPIYTAFVNKKSSAYRRFEGKKIVTSWAQNVPFFASYLHSPFRFLAPLIWGSFDFSDFDVVIGSSSWYVTKGFRKGGVKRVKGDKGRKGFVEVCYCHTPPRYLYGYPTSVDWQKYWPVKVYAALVNHFMRVYDFESAQKVDYFIANSREVAGRIKKFYRRESTVIYPPVDVKKFTVHPSFIRAGSSQFTEKKRSDNRQQTTENYFLVVSRLVASKKVDIAVEVCAKLGLPLKVVGVGKEMENLKKLANRLQTTDYRIEHKKAVDGRQLTVDFLGEVSDEELVNLYQGARAVIFPASQEDFGLVPVEAAAAGVPVIANKEGGVLESVIEDKTGLFFSPSTVGSLTMAVNKFIDLEKKGYFDPLFIQKHAQKFSKERFKGEILDFVKSKLK